MTPRQRRLHRAGLETVAAAPRKSWLGRFTPLNGIQSAWIKSLLTVWGEGMRGGAAPRKPSGHSCWRGMKGDHWSDRALERFTTKSHQKSLLQLSLKVTFQAEFGDMTGVLMQRISRIPLSYRRKAKTPHARGLRYIQIVAFCRCRVAQLCQA